MWLVKSPIENQICEFVVYKLGQKGTEVARKHKIWLDLFWSKTKVNSVLDITPDHVIEFKEWLEGHYNGRHHPEDALRTLNQFLRFYKLQRLMEAVKKKRVKVAGRKLDLEKRDLALKFLNLGLDYRTIADNIYKLTGERPSIGSITYWKRVDLKKSNV